MKFSNEFKTGIMVLTCLVILVVMILNVADFGLESKGYHLYVLFRYGGGVLKNAPVRLAGVDVGKVDSVDIIYDKTGTNVRLDLLISDKAMIRTDSKIYISNLGLMGEKYVEISPGSAKAEYVVPESTLRGENPFQVEEIVDNTKQTLIQVQRLTNNLNIMLEDNQQTINNTLQNFEATSVNFSKFSEDIRHNPWKLFIKQKDKRKKQASNNDNTDSGATKNIRSQNKLLQ